MVSTRIDWSQLWYPGPRRPFGADEMARAGMDAPSPTQVTITFINFSLLAFMALQLVPRSQMARATGLLVATGALGAVAARWLWQRPWRLSVLRVSLVATLLLTLASGPVLGPIADREERRVVALVMSGGSMTVLMSLWFMVTWRWHQIDARLREMAERDRAVEMARRLAAAQIEPHFLFNTLASLQHWVHTRDARAAPMLDALVGYLRATLPMFKLPVHALADELEAVRRYLEVMAARFGERLHWAIDVPPALHAVPLPPGLLLTLVENAVVHGVEPRIEGGRIDVRGQVQATGQVLLEVQDDGPGPPPDAAEGTGLANCRARLALTCGADASLTLTRGTTGGAIARVQFDPPR